MSSTTTVAEVSDLERHPAWPWLGRVAGVTPPLAVGLLSRLDAARASTPSAFWAYCGLATVARPGGGRVAQPSRAREESKRICHALGMSMVRASGAYARAYRQERTRLAATRPHWTEDRRHITALRKMEKLFLAHLWIVWRESLQLPLTTPHEDDRRAELGPWDMVGGPRRRWIRHDRPSTVAPRTPGSPAPD